MTPFWKITYLCYIVPVIITVSIFTYIKIMDFYTKREKRFYEQEYSKITYSKMMLFCIIPIANAILVMVILIAAFVGIDKALYRETI